MDQKPIKILELSGNKWMSGLALQTFAPIGGAFRLATNFDPFQKMGTYKPSIQNLQIGSNTVTTAGYYNVGYATGGLGYFYSFGNSNKVFSIKTSDGTVTDVSAQVSGYNSIQGAVKFQNKIVYAGDLSTTYTTVKANAIPLSLASQVGIMSLAIGYAHIFKIGPDRNLYVTNGPNIGRITSVTGTSGNNQNYLSFESDVVTRDVESVGDHLAILGDTNTSVGGSRGTNRCFVGFWNMKSNDLSQIWEFEDVQVYGMKWTGEELIVFGFNNIYTCTIDSPIRPLVSMQGSTTFTRATIYQGGIVRNDGQVVWGMGSNIYSYGRPNVALNKIFAHLNTVGGSGSIVSIFADGEGSNGRGFWAMTDDNKLYGLGTAASGNNVVNSSLIYLTDVDFKNPYRFAFAKIVLVSALASGQSVLLQVNSQNGSKLVLNSSGIDFATDGAISNKIVYPLNNTTNMTPFFEDITLFSITNTKAHVRRIEFWAYPVDPTTRAGY